MDTNLEKLFVNAKVIDLGEFGTVRMRYLPMSKIPEFSNIIFKALSAFAKTKQGEERGAFDILTQTISTCGEEILKLIQTCVDVDLETLPGAKVGPVLIGEFFNMNMEDGTLKKWSALLENTLGIQLLGNSTDEDQP